jgi:hypothetical protein
MALLNALVFLILGWYLDQVFPNEWGHKKHPLFFLTCFFNIFKKKDLKETASVSNGDDENQLANARP